MSSQAGRRVAVVSGDPLPLPGLPTSGAGLRAWQLGQGLRACGHQVQFLMYDVVRRRFPHVPLGDVQVYTETTLRQCLLELQPDVVVFQHWSQIGLVLDLEIPFALDMHGPVMLEISHRDPARVASLCAVKIRNIQRADFLSCAGVRQRAYFYAWMVLAGYDMRHSHVHVIPVALSPETPAHNPGAEPVFVYGGVLLPWQDPGLALRTLVAVLEQHGRGQLQLFAGPHPVQSLHVPQLEALIAELRTSPYVTHPGLVPHEQLLSAYAQASLAVDLMAPNPERELAFTTRTVEYLWCGLPVIYNNYAELADYIAEYQAGWTIDPLDPVAIRHVVEQVLDDPADLAWRSANAQRLIRERLNWTVTVTALDQFCRNPQRWTAQPDLSRQSMLDDDWSWFEPIRARDLELARLTHEVERKNRHIAELESLIGRLQNGRIMRLLRWLGRG